MAIIGNGDIASAIIDRPGFTFFASGVSNSSEHRIDEFMRELNLLKEQDIDKHLVYFSTLSQYYKDPTPYTEHKAMMERNVKREFQYYTIVRLGNIDWGKNPNTLINYLKAHPEAEIQKVYRHVVSKHEFQYWLGWIVPDARDIMNIPGRMVWMPDFIKEIRNGKG